jgi:hypothetical protein
LTDWMIAVSRASNIWSLKDFLGKASTAVFMTRF